MSKDFVVDLCSFTMSIEDDEDPWEQARDRLNYLIETKDIDIDNVVGL